MPRNHWTIRRLGLNLDSRARVSKSAASLCACRDRKRIRMGRRVAGGRMSGHDIWSHSAPANIADTNGPRKSVSDEGRFDIKAIRLRAVYSAAYAYAPGIHPARRPRRAAGRRQPWRGAVPGIRTLGRGAQLPLGDFGLAGDLGAVSR
jgi:hypothetical protein